MSAFILSPKHIDALLNFVNRDECPPCVVLSDGREIDFRQSADLDFCAALLTAQNYASVNSRYCERNCPGAPTVFHFGFTAYSPVEIIKACDSYDYQACETPDYFDGDAAKIVAAIRGAAITAMPEYKAAKTWRIK